MSAIKISMGELTGYQLPGYQERIQSILGILWLSSPSECIWSLLITYYKKANCWSWLRFLTKFDIHRVDNRHRLLQVLKATYLISRNQFSKDFVIILWWPFPPWFENSCIFMALHSRLLPYGSQICRHSCTLAQFFDFKSPMTKSLGSLVLVFYWEYQKYWLQRQIG